MSKHLRESGYQQVTDFPGIVPLTPQKIKFEIVRKVILYFLLEIDIFLTISEKERNYKLES